MNVVIVKQTGRNVSLEEALRMLLNVCFPVDECYIPVHESGGKILSKDITSGRNIPLFDKSAVDGYALQSRDTRDVSNDSRLILGVIDKTRAGFMPGKSVISGTAVRIMTGAPIPGGADSVIKFEDVIPDGDSIVISRDIKKGSNVAYAGDEVKSGELIARCGTRITPPLAGIMAGLGMDDIPVYRKVRVAILNTGDELLRSSGESTACKIYNSSYSMLAARCVETGVEPVSLGIAPDDVKATAERLAAGLGMADIVITTGGVSAGDYDLVDKGMISIDAGILIKGIAIKSGSPLLAGVKDGKLLIGLSGNPAAALMTFDLLVVPLIRKLMGLSRPLPVRMQVVMADNFLKKSPARRLVSARLFRQDGVDYVKLNNGQDSRSLMSMINNNFMVDIPAGSGYITCGQNVSGFPAGDLHSFDESTAFIPVVIPAASRR